MSHNPGSNPHKLPPPANPASSTDLAPVMRLYNVLTESNPRDRPLLAKAKALARKGDEALMAEPSRNLEQYREDERKVRAKNDPKMSLGCVVM
jgi:hypothetical protein